MLSSRWDWRTVLPLRRYQSLIFVPLRQLESINWRLVLSNCRESQPSFRYSLTRKVEVTLPLPLPFQRTCVLWKKNVRSDCWILGIPSLERTNHGNPINPRPLAKVEYLPKHYWFQVLENPSVDPGGYWWIPVDVGQRGVVDGCCCYRMGFTWRRDTYNWHISWKSLKGFPGGWNWQWQVQCVTSWRRGLVKCCNYMFSIVLCWTTVCLQSPQNVLN